MHIRKNELIIIDQINVLPLGNNETGQFAKDASEVYKRLKTDPEQFSKYTKKLDNWTKTATKKQQATLWDTLNKSYNQLNQEVKHQYGAECITMFAGGLLDGQYISVSSGIKRKNNIYLICGIGNN